MKKNLIKAIQLRRTYRRKRKDIIQIMELEGVIKREIKQSTLSRLIKKYLKFMSQDSN